MKVKNSNRTVYIDFEKNMKEDINVLIGVPVINLDISAICTFNEIDRCFCWRNVKTPIVNIRNANKHVNAIVFPTIETTPVVLSSPFNYIELAINKYKKEKREIESFFIKRDLKRSDKDIEFMENIRCEIENYRYTSGILL